MLLACPQFVQYSWPPTWPRTGWPVGQTLCTIRSSNLFRPTLFRTIVTSSCGNLMGLPHLGQMLLLIGHFALSRGRKLAGPICLDQNPNFCPIRCKNLGEFCSIIFCESNPAGFCRIDLCSGSLSMRESDHQASLMNCDL